MFGKKKERDQAFSSRQLQGIPSVFTGRDTTIGELRQMSQAVANETWTTATERGLAISMLEVLKMFEQEVKRCQREHFS